MCSASPKHKNDHWLLQRWEPAFQPFVFGHTDSLFNSQIQQISLRFTIIFNEKAVVKSQVAEAVSSTNPFLWGHCMQREDFIWDKPRKQNHYAKNLCKLHSILYVAFNGLTDGFVQMSVVTAFCWYFKAIKAFFMLKLVPLLSQQSIILFSGWGRYKSVCDKPIGFCLQAYLNHLREPKAGGRAQIYRLLSEFISPKPPPLNEVQMFCRRKWILRGGGALAVGGSCSFPCTVCMYVAYLKSSIGPFHLARRQGFAETFFP